MTEKRKNPYESLLDDFRAYHHKVQYPQRREMWTYPKAKLRESWSLAELHERVAAANQIGYDVVLEATDEGLKVIYRQRPPESPHWKL